MMHHGAPGTVLLGQVWVSGMGEAGAGAPWVPGAGAASARGTRAGLSPALQTSLDRF